MRLTVFLVLLLLAFNAAAKEAQPMAKDPELEARVDKLANELRCLVCKNQTIADSNAALAKDLKRQVREMLAAGKSNDEVVDYMVERYGDFVMYRPPLRAKTVLLWSGPALLLIIGGFILLVSLKNRSREVAQQAPSEVDLSKAESILSSDQEGKS